MTLVKKARPDLDFAAEEVCSLTVVSWGNGTLNTSGGAILNLPERLRADAPSTGTPTVVFYTAESARDAKGKTTPSALASAKVYSDILNPLKNRLACYYARRTNLVKIDVSGTTPVEDKMLNNTTAPIIAFYAADGTCVSTMNARSLNEQTFCNGVLRIMPNPGESAANARKFQQELATLENLAKNLYMTREKLQEAQGRMSGRKTGTSVQEKLVDALTKKETELAGAVAEKKEMLDAL